MDLGSGYKEKADYGLGNLVFGDRNLGEERKKALIRAYESLNRRRVLYTR